MPNLVSNKPTPFDWPSGKINAKKTTSGIQMSPQITQLKPLEKITKVSKLLQQAETSQISIELKHEDHIPTTAETLEQGAGTQHTMTEFTPVDDFPCADPYIRKCKSLPNLHFLSYDTLKVDENFQSIMKEIEVQRQHLILTSVYSARGYPSVKRSLSEQKVQVSENLDSAPTNQLIIEATKIEAQETEAKSPLPPTFAKKTSGQKHASFQKRKKSLRKKSLGASKLAFVQAKMNLPPRILTRHESLPILPRPIEPRLRVPKWMRHQRSSSLPFTLGFEAFVKAEGGIGQNVVEREWVRAIWDKWFDEVFPATEGPSDLTDDKKVESQATKEKELMANRESMLKEIELQNLVSLRERAKLGVQAAETWHPLLNVDLGVTENDLQFETNKLTQIIEKPNAGTAFDYCRRGALYRKLGELKLAMDDLNKAIEMEPKLLDAYWHRHLIFVLQLKVPNALEDLNYVLKNNKIHADAYRSKAEIYRSRGEITMAIINYTQALKCKPDDETYFRRGEMHEHRNEVRLAMEDYSLAISMNPKRLDALMKRAKYYFNISNWNVAIQDYTSIIQYDPTFAKARNLRGQAYAKQGLYQKAILDLSAAIHLDPNDWEAFYHRGCLLRKVEPHKAIQDFSVSVLINNEIENLDTFLFRGILYTQLNLWPEAIFDFETVLRLDSAISVAHVNLGLIFLLKMNQYFEAIRRFTNAIKVDPTYARAYVCRAEAHHKIHDLRNSLRDLTNAIHLQPDVQYFYLLRGQYLYEMKRYELARFCIVHAAEINQALGSSRVQQAAIQTFLKHYDRAIDCLAAVDPSPVLCILLGKTQMKAKKFEDALVTFKKGLQLLPPQSKPLDTLTETAEIHYLMGLAYSQNGNLIEAFESFNKALKLFPLYALAYYQRGLCRMGLQETNYIQDFHRALDINPNLFEVFISRAIFYGLQGRYFKALLSCNKALMIQPKSVRVFIYRGTLKFFIKAYKTAIADLNSAIAIDNVCSLAFFNRAVCYHQINEYDKALKDYGIVMLLGGLKEVDFKLLINRGLLYFKMEDYYSAIQDFKAASVLQPTNDKICHALGFCKHKIGQLTKAVNVFTKAVKLNPFFVDAYFGRGNVYMDYRTAAGTKEAQKDFLRALHLDPLCEKARISLAYNFQVLGRYQKAWNHFTIAIDNNPNFQDAYEGRAVINLQMNDTFAAFQDINAALKISKSAKLLTNRGVINQFMGHLPSAMADYKMAITLDPKFSLAYFNAANLYFHNKQFKQADDYYTKAIDLDPGDESAVLNRAISRVLLQNVQGALEDFEQAIALSPFTAHIYFNRANLYFTLKQYSDAERDFSRALELKPDDALIYKLRADVRGKLGRNEDAISDYKKAIDVQNAIRNR
ncbi:uncharacterized protein LOC103178545 [Callorhinchus milii]|uniref:uncharacterized protein LOC103178545 n=1 Tax=Callorhinchus milii TaxID=7868 RepID=UPI001C3F6B26|nr:uncharacterized protein LOC103178545 [Callorhinchus milii]